MDNDSMDTEIIIGNITFFLRVFLWTFQWFFFKKNLFVTCLNE